MKKPLIAKRHQSKDLHDLSAFSTEGADSLINLSVGDPDFHTADVIIEGAFADAKNGHTHYTSGLGQLELRQAVCDDLADSHGKVPVENCMITTSACHAMWLVLEAVVDDGDEVIVFSPYFSPYTDQIKLARGIPVDCPMNAVSGGFEIDISRLKASITSKTRALIINSPNNPTGGCHTKEMLESIAAIAIEYDLLVIADDIYTAFTYQSPHIPIAALPNMAEYTVTLGSFSKNYCMTGWRIGYAIAPAEVIGVMESINQSVIFSPPSISQRAALHAIKNKASVQPAIIETIRERAAFIQRELNTLKGVTCAEIAGGMYAFPDISGTGLSAKEFTDYLLKEANIRVIPGEAFGEAGAGHVRIALTVSVPVLEQAFERMRALPLFAS